MTQKQSLFTINPAAYAKRAKQAAEAVQALGKGARFRISVELGVPAITISDILNGVRVDPDRLAGIEGWLSAQGAPGKKGKVAARQE